MDIKKNNSNGRKSKYLKASAVILKVQRLCNFILDITIKLMNGIDSVDVTEEQLGLCSASGQHSILYRRLDI